MILIQRSCPSIRWKLVLRGIEVYDILRDEYDIQIEFGDIGNILAYLSIGDRIQEIERLGECTGRSKEKISEDKTGMLSQEYIEPEVIMSPQDLFMRKKRQCRSGV